MFVGFLLLLVLVAVIGGKGCVKGLVSVVFGAMLLMAGCAIV